MEIMTSRFGAIQSDEVTRIDFPKGLIGLPHLRRFVVFRDSLTPRLTWLQSVRNASWAMALVHPTRVISGYRISITAEQLDTVEYRESGSLESFVVLNEVAKTTVANLAAPILIVWESGLGIQLQVKEQSHSIRRFLESEVPLRKSA